MTDTIRIWIAIAAPREPRLAQLHVRERGQPPARERDGQQAQQIGDAEDHLQDPHRRARATRPLQQVVQLLNSRAIGSPMRLLPGS